MDLKLQKLYNNQIFSKFKVKFGGSNYSEASGFESFVYEFERNNLQLILKVSHSSRRTPEEIQGEIDYLNYLHDENIPVALVEKSMSGNFVEVEEADEGFFTGICFRKADGRHIKKEDKTPKLFHKMGKLQAAMHNSAEKANLNDIKFHRPDCFSMDRNLVRDSLSENDNEVITIYDDLLAVFDRQEKTSKNYGIMHYDFHPGNFFINGDKLTLFDFDDSVYFWFNADMAITLFYQVPHHIKTQKEFDSVKLFLDNFLKGYTEIRCFDSKCITEFSNYMKMREIILYAILQVSGLAGKNAWVDGFLNNRKNKIINHVPYLDFSRIGY